MEPKTVAEALEEQLAVLGSVKLEDAWNENHYDPRKKGFYLRVKRSQGNATG